VIEDARRRDIEEFISDRRAYAAGRDSDRRPHRRSDRSVSDLVDFTSLTARVSPEQTVELLGDLFSRFDALAAQHGLEKIKTTGDGYMVAGGLPEERADHAVAVAEMALAMLDAVDTAGRTAGQPLQLRIGLDTGALIAGVLGTHKFVYDVWGDTVNTAKHMESYPVEPGHVHVSATTRRALGDAFRFEPRGLLDIKGKRSMETYFVCRRKKEAGTL
jgi:adenylate cyclase